MNIYNGFKTMIFSDGESLQKKTIAVKGIVFYVKYFAITYPILATLAILAHLLKWDISNHIVNGVFREAIMGHPMNAIIVNALFAPLLEEIVFRLWLSFSKKDIAVSSFCLCYLALTFFQGTLVYPKLITYGLQGFTDSAFLTAVGSKLLWSFLASGLTVAIFTMLQSRITPKVKDVAAAASVLLFMLLHVTNYDLSLPLLPLAVIMCTPQLLLGITATYFRRHLGFFYGYLLHILVNFITVSGYILNGQNVLGS